LVNALLASSDESGVTPASRSDSLASIGVTTVALLISRMTHVLESCTLLATFYPCEFAAFEYWQVAPTPAVIEATLVMVLRTFTTMTGP